jgi:hypothetical protein
VTYFKSVLTIVSKEDAHKAAQSDYEQALAQAETQQCEQSAESWRQARYHVWRDTSWRAERHSNMMSALSICYVNNAENAESEAQKIEALFEARLYDHQQPRMLAESKVLAQDLAARGEALLEQGDGLLERRQSLKSFFGWIGDDFLANTGSEALADDLMGEELERQAKTLATEAYPLLRDAMKMDPTLSSVRRSAERARDLALNIQAKERDSARRKREREEAKERRQRNRARSKRERQELQRSPRLQEDRPEENSPIERPSVTPRLPPGMIPKPPGSKRENRESIRLPLGSPRPAPTENRPSPSID